MKSKIILKAIEPVFEKYIEYAEGAGPTPMMKRDAFWSHVNNRNFQIELHSAINKVYRDLFPDAPKSVVKNTTDNDVKNTSDFTIAKNAPSATTKKAKVNKVGLPKAKQTKYDALLQAAKELE